MEFSVSGLDELMLSMKEIEEIPEDVVDEMLNAQADVLIEAQKAEGKTMGVHRTGLTLSKIRKTKVKRTKGGGRAIYVYPHGSRKRGEKSTRNAEIAFVNEFGKRGQRARPFIHTANERSAEKTTKAAFVIYDRWLKSKNL